MKRTQWILLAVLVVLGVVVAVLAARNRQAPILPDDEVHYQGPIPAACDECHAYGADFARSKNHPLGNDCLRCHGRP
jgi:hypothetical protein